MPDRRLKSEEMAKFLQEKTRGKLSFNALNALSEESTEPSLHDLCLHELYAIAQAHREYVIFQGKEIEQLKERIKALEEKKKGEV